MHRCRLDVSLWIERLKHGDACHNESKLLKQGLRPGIVAKYVERNARELQIIGLVDQC